MAKPYSRCNFLLIGKDELAKKAPTEGSGTLIFTPTVFKALTPTPTLDLRSFYMDVDL